MQQQMNVIGEGSNGWAAIPGTPLSRHRSRYRTGRTSFLLSPYYCLLSPSFSPGLTVVVDPWPCYLSSACEPILRAQQVLIQFVCLAGCSPVLRSHVDQPWHASSSRAHFISFLLSFFLPSCGLFALMIPRLRCVAKEDFDK